MTREAFADQRGSSLAEALVALGVFGIGVLGIASMFLVATAQKRQTFDREAAYELVIAEFEQLGALPYSQVPEAIATKQVERAGGTVFTLSYDVDSGENEATWEPGDEELDYNMKRLTLSVWWRGIGPRVQRLSLANLRLRS